MTTPFDTKTLCARASAFSRANMEATDTINFRAYTLVENSIIFVLKDKTRTK